MSLKNSPSKVKALSSFDKEINLPASKSHSNRALILGAIRGGSFKVHNLSTSTDVTNLLDAFKKIGLSFLVNGTSVTFLNTFPECEKASEGEVIELSTGDGGTTNRFLIALLSRGKKEYHLRPSEKMNERPIEDLLAPLKKIGVLFSHNIKNNPLEPWLKMKGPATLYNTSKLEIDCSKSTQFATALMLAFSNRPLQFDFINLHASEMYIKMTSQVMKKSLEANSYIVPVDFSSLGYPIALAAVKGRVLIKNCLEIDTFQPDSQLIEILKVSGARRVLSASGLEVKKDSPLKAFNFDVSKAPDLFPTLVFLAAHSDGVSVLSNLNILKFKESDRLHEMMNLMKVFGVEMDYDSSADLIQITGSTSIKYKHAVVQPARDHRIVMSAALFMAANLGGELYEIDCVEKSFPGFFSLLE